MDAIGALTGFFRRRMGAPLIPPAPGQSAYSVPPVDTTETDSLTAAWRPQRLARGEGKYWGGFANWNGVADDPPPAAYSSARSMLEFNWLSGAPRRTIGYFYYPGLDLRGWNGQTMGDVQFAQTLNAPPPYIAQTARRVASTKSIRQGIVDNQQTAFGRWSLPNLRAPRGYNG